MLPGVECSVMPDGSSSSIDQETPPRHVSRFIVPPRIFNDVGNAGDNTGDNASHDGFQVRFQFCFKRTTRSTTEVHKHQDRPSSSVH